MLESSGGQNVNHKPTKSGDTAVGQYGLMPKTVKEMANRRRLDNMADEQDMLILNPKTDVQSLLQDPAVQEKYAQEIASRLLNKTGGDMRLAATEWLYGHNAPIEKLQKKYANDQDYQRRIEENMPYDIPEYLQKQSRQPTSVQPDVKQTLDSILNNLLPKPIKLNKG